MGLGKTVPGYLSGLLVQEGVAPAHCSPFLSQVPWIEEMEKWIPELNPGDINLVENKMDVS